MLSAIVGLKKIQLRSQPAEFCCGRQKARASLPQSQVSHAKAVRAFYSSSEQTTLHLMTQKVMSVEFLKHLSLIQSFRRAQARKYGKLGAERQPGETEKECKGLSVVPHGTANTFSAEIQAVHTFFCLKSVDKPWTS